MVLKLKFESKGDGQSVDIFELYKKLQNIGLLDETVKKIIGFDRDADIDFIKDEDKLNSTERIKFSYLVGCLEHVGSGLMSNEDRLISIIKTLEESYSISPTFLSRLSNIDEQVVLDFLNGQSINNKDMFDLSMVVMYIYVVVSQIISM